MKHYRAIAALALTVTGSPVASQDFDRSSLPIMQGDFDGVMAHDIEDANQGSVLKVKAPEAAPNVFLFMSDDVGFAMASTFGGPVPTPNFDRLARGGVRYNQFHTTGICSPSRAALLTGRNHHNAGFGYLGDLPAGFDGYMAEIPRSTASVAEILKLNGYNTAMFGKTHNVKTDAISPAGPFDQWPTGQGFEYFWGIVGGDTDQFSPAVYRGITRLPDAPDAPIMEKRMADEAIGWMHQQQAAAPDKPFFVYYAPGSTHAPHQAPADWIARYRGQFDMGWDRMREISYARMKAEGIIPETAELTERPDEIPAWDSLTPKGKAFASRSMEVAAAMLAYQDAQVGRILDEMERTGEGRNLLTIFVIGDNGASAESGVTGTVNELGKINGNVESEDFLYSQIDALGGPTTYPAYPAGWAWAMNTPLRWTKQYTSMLGGIRNGLIMKWNDRAVAPGTVCPQFGHVIDIAPTILDAANIPSPTSVNGVRQKPMDGISLLSSLQEACRPETPRTQYFEMGGKIGLWHNGWFAALDDGRTPWMSSPPEGWDRDDWKLYNLSVDFSQADDVAEEHPAKLAELITLWEAAADANNVYPLNHNFGFPRVIAQGGLPNMEQRNSFDYWAAGISVPVMSAPQFAGRSFTLTADLGSNTANPSGVIAAVGSRFAGWSLFLEKGRPVFVYAASTRPQDVVRITASRNIAPGERLKLQMKAQGPRQPAEFSIIAGDETIASGMAETTFMLPAGLGETFDVGHDLGVPVTDYSIEKFDGWIENVHVDLAPPQRGGSAVGH